MDSPILQVFLLYKKRRQIVTISFEGCYESSFPELVSRAPLVEGRTCMEPGRLKIIHFSLLFIDSAWSNGQFVRLTTHSVSANSELHLRWLNTVLAVFQYMSFAKPGQEKGCSLKAKTWQVKNILIKDFDRQVKFDIFVVSMAT